MNRYAVFHTPDIPYAYAVDKDTLHLRLRTARNDIREAKVHYKDRYDLVSPFQVKVMKVAAEGPLFSFYEAEVSLFRNRYRYFFELKDKRGKSAFFDDRGFREETETLKDRERTAFHCAYIGEADVYPEVRWLQQSIIYQIFPDRFFNGDRSNDPVDTPAWGGAVTSRTKFGGDIKGIIEKLDYLKDLGINLVYLTPVFKSDSNHKYNTGDYYEIDPQFGTKEDARDLVRGCHERGMRVVFDAVFNHSGSDFFAFQDVLKNQEKSAYVDWYHIDSFPVETGKVNYYTFAERAAYMPKLNTANRKVKDYLIEVGKYWVEEIGIDGWRLDVSDEVDHSFWRDFTKAVKAVRPDAVVIGEIMHEAPAFLRGDEMDGIMNYPFKVAMVDFFATRTIDAEAFNGILARNRASYMNSISRQMWNLIGSHDTKRFLTECDDRVERLKLATAFQFFYIGVPYIYYGDEVGMSGALDPYCRGCMLWEEDEQDRDLHRFYKRLIHLRRLNKELIYGDFEILHLEGNVLVFRRTYEGKSIVVALNNSDREAHVRKRLGDRAVDLITAETITLRKGLTMKPMEFRVFRIRNKEKGRGTGTE